MELFGIGILEILAVGLLMAIVFGPHRLPEIAKQGGKAVRELREYARDFRDEYLTDFEEVREEFLEVRHELEATDSEFRQEMKDLDADLRATVKDAEQDAEKALKGAETAAKGAADAASDADAGGVAITETPSTLKRIQTEAGKTTRRVSDKRERRVPRGRRRGGGDDKGSDAPARPGKVISINRRKSSG